LRSRVSAFLSVHDPALWAATLFKQSVISRGIKVDGEARTRDFRVASNDNSIRKKLSSLRTKRVSRSANRPSNK